MHVLKRSMSAVNNIQVEVAYACPEVQAILPVNVPVGATVEEAIAASDILKDFPDINLGDTRVGVFSEWVSLKHVVRAGDRIEIYRPLVVDPKQARLLKVKKTTAS